MSSRYEQASVESYIHHTKDSVEIYMCGFNPRNVAPFLAGIHRSQLVVGWHFALAFPPCLAFRITLFAGEMGAG